MKPAPHSKHGQAAELLPLDLGSLSKVIGGQSACEMAFGTPEQYGACMARLETERRGSRSGGSFEE